jgi:hypothetical protein
MADQAELEKGFDAALSQVERLLGTEMKTITGASARGQLEELGKDLKRERANTLERRTVDREWFQKTVRDVIEWVPDNEVTLVAALGGIIRTAQSGTSSP